MRLDSTISRNNCFLSSKDILQTYFKRIVKCVRNTHSFMKKQAQSDDAIGAFIWLATGVVFYIVLLLNILLKQFKNKTDVSEVCQIVYYK